MTLRYWRSVRVRVLGRVRVRVRIRARVRVRVRVGLGLGLGLGLDALQHKFSVGMAGVVQRTQDRHGQY